jgi:hypothetical protein
VFTTSTVASDEVDDEAVTRVGKEEVGPVVGSVPATVAASVGAGLRHLSTLMP